MTEAMVVEAVKAAGTMPQAVQPQTVAAAVDPSAIARFQNAMGVDGTTPVPLASQIAETWGVAQESHQGILHRIKALTELRGVRGPSAAEMAELQYEVANLAFQQEVVANVAKKASDAVSTLIKNG